MGLGGGDSGTEKGRAEYNSFAWYVLRVFLEEGAGLKFLKERLACECKEIAYGETAYKNDGWRPVNGGRMHQDILVFYYPEGNISTWTKSTSERDGRINSPVVSQDVYFSERRFRRDMRKLHINISPRADLSRLVELFPELLPKLTEEEAA